MKLGVDISHWNTITDWEKITLSVDFVIQKCTEAISYKDPTFETNKKNALKNKLTFGSYHFARGGDVKKEAEWYLKNCGECDLYILDWEIEHKDPVKWCKDFLDIVAKKTGKIPYLYTNDARAIKYNFKDYPMWVARYGINDGTPNKEPKFKDWKIWQYTSRGKIDGIQGFVDLNIMPESPVASNLPHSGVFVHYSQNDPLWKNERLGGSNLTLGGYGCLTADICTLASWFGETFTPKYLASHKELYTKGGLIIWKQLENILKTLNFLYRYYSFNEQIVDEYLIKNPDTCVVLQVDRGYHWVAAINKSKTGYKCVDPWAYLPKIRVYKFSEISGFAVLIKK